MSLTVPPTTIARMGPDVPAPESVPPVDHPDPQPNDPKPKAPPAEDDDGRRLVPVDLPGRPHAPERVSAARAADATRG